MMGGKLVGLLVNGFVLVFVGVVVGVDSSKVTGLDGYDFIIVGGGTAGLAVARRLVESPKQFTVLVIETGGFPKDGMEIPANTPVFIGDPEVTFRYRTVPQYGAGLFDGGVIGIVAGKMLGGTSSLNYMWYNRGNPKDYDNWANRTRDEGWSYKSMLPHFKRVETYTGEFPSDQHGFKGPITVSQPKYAPGLEHWLAAGASLGYSVGDPNGPQRVGFSPVEFSKRFGRRVSSFTGYINPILKSASNLHILTKTNGTRIVFEGNRAVGVRIRSSLPELSDLPEDYCVYAKKEVIVSSGSYGSAMMLQRSGIGPKEILDKAGIEVVKELPVGLNLQGHVYVPLHFLVNDSSVLFDEERDLSLENFEQFQRDGDGPYTSGRGATGQFFYASSVAKSEGQSDWGDVQLVMEHSTLSYASGFPVTFSDNRTLRNGDVGMHGSVWLMRPKSRGSISVNPEDPVGGMPVIDFGYLIDPRDVEALLDGVHEMIYIYENTKPYMSIGTRLRRPDVPDCDDKFKYRSIPYWKCYIRQMSQGACHPAGTCAMGRGRKDPRAVVDSKLRVIGIDNLRVVDNSIMPFITNGNTQAPAYGIAEKGASMILESWS